MPSTRLRGANARLKTILSSEETYATTLFAIMVDRLVDPDDPQSNLQAVCGWHPQTRRMELEQEIGAKMPVINSDKLNAAVQIYTSDAFFQRVDPFIKLCNVLSGTPMAYATFDPADADECAWGITEAMLLAPPDEPEPFAEEILWYIGKVLDEEGIKSPPDVLRIAKREHKPDFAGMSLDDPSMFQAEFKVQEDEGKELERVLRVKLVELLRELEQTPFEHGSAEGLMERVKGGLRHIGTD